jgi:molybdenum cofactor cytidylyltransferase
MWLLRRRELQVEFMPIDVSCHTITVGVVILGAGASSRMGSPKLLLPWGNTSVLGHLLEQWTSLRPKQIAVVYAEGNAAFEQELNHLGFPPQNRINNPKPESGMFSSIQCASRWPGWRIEVTHWAIVLGDQPHLMLSTLERLIGFAAANASRICQPSRNGRPRHPVLLPRAVFSELTRATEENLKQFLQHHSHDRALCEMDDSGLDFDIDEPADYERALREFRSVH